MHIWKSTDLENTTHALFHYAHERWECTHIHTWTMKAKNVYMHTCIMNAESVHMYTWTMNAKSVYMYTCTMNNESVHMYIWTVNVRVYTWTCVQWMLRECVHTYPHADWHLFPVLRSTFVKFNVDWNNNLQNFR